SLTRRGRPVTVPAVPPQPGRPRSLPMIRPMLAAAVGAALAAALFAGRAAAQELLVTVRIDGNAEIVLYNAETGKVKNLTRHPAEDSYPAWSPDGQKIAFASNRSGTTNVYVMDADGGN